MERKKLLLAAAALSLVGPPALAQIDGPGDDQYTLQSLYLIPVGTAVGSEPVELVLTDRLEEHGLDRADGLGERQSVLDEIVSATRDLAECIGVTMESAADAVSEHACAGDVAFRHSRDPRERFADLLTKPVFTRDRTGTISQDDSSGQSKVERWQEVVDDTQKDLDDLDQQIDHATKMVEWSHLEFRKRKASGDHDRMREASEKIEYWREAREKAARDRDKVKQALEDAKAALEKARKEEEEEDDEEPTEEDCEGEDCPPQEEDEGDQRPGPGSEQEASAECKAEMARRLEGWRAPQPIDPDPTAPPGGEMPGAFACLVATTVIQGCALDTEARPSPDDPRSSLCDEGEKPVFEVLRRDQLWTDPSPEGDGTSPSPAEGPTAPPREGPQGPTVGGPGSGPRPVPVTREVEAILEQLLGVTAGRTEAIGL